MTQTELNFGTPANSLSVAIKQRDEAMAKVEANAGEDWNDYAMRVIQRVANRLQVFTSDDVMEALLVLPHDSRALGPAMKRAAARGIIVATDNFRPSHRRHATPIRIWEKAL